ncbi:MAG: hypothetical protein NC409_12435 [Clostridium sp.]|nr:hypothetical protein [Clostridium sp.]
MAKESKVEAAESKAETVAGLAQASGKEQKAAQEAVYAIGEFVGAAKKIFGKSPECVAAALKAAGKTGYTVAEARAVVEKYLKREVQ